MTVPDPDAPTLAELARGLARVEGELRAWRAEVATAMESRARDTVSVAVWQAERAALTEAVAREVAARAAALAGEANARAEQRTVLEASINALRATVDEERRGRQSGQRALYGAVVAAILAILGQYVQLGGGFG